ncbi:MAG: hypothetical protein ACRD2U_02660 [Terriglobales bacterium]
MKISEHSYQSISARVFCRALSVFLILAAPLVFAADHASPRASALKQSREQISRSGRNSSPANSASGVAVAKLQTANESQPVEGSPSVSNGTAQCAPSGEPGKIGADKAAGDTTALDAKQTSEVETSDENFVDQDFVKDKLQLSIETVPAKADNNPASCGPDNVPE